MFSLVSISMYHIVKEINANIGVNVLLGSVSKKNDIPFGLSWRKCSADHYIYEKIPSKISLVVLLAFGSEIYYILATGYVQCSLGSDTLHRTNPYLHE